MVIQAFHDDLRKALGEAHAGMLRNPTGGGPEAREFHRALMLTDRAARDWLGAALARAEPTMQNHLEALPTISMPEDGLNILGPASSLVQGWSSHDYRHRVGTQARALGEAVADIDTESSGTQNRDAFLAVAENAAASLILASEQLGGEEFVVEQGNAALGDLIALNEWENRLGPRFEL